MKFAKSLYRYSLISSVSSLAAAQNADSSASASPSVAKIGFNKLYGKSFPEAAAEHQKTSQTGSKDSDVDLKNQNSYYSVNISIGDPGQDVTVQLDTGSSDLWVIAPGGLHCPQENMQKRDGIFGDPLGQLESYLDGGSDGEYSTSFNPDPDPFAFPTGSASGSSSSSTPGPSSAPDVGNNGGSSEGGNCQTTGYFDVKKSKTFQKNNTDPFYIQYEDYTYAKGFWGTDDLQIGGLNVSNASFVVSDDTNSTSPVLGIGFLGDESSYATSGSGNSPQHPHKYANFPQLLKDQGKTQAVAYSLYLNSPNAADGNVLFGGVDHSQYKGQLYTLPVLKLNELTGSSDPYTDLAVTLQGVELTSGGSTNSVGSDKHAAVLDSGTTVVYLPDDIVQNIASQYSGSLTNEGYAIECPQDADNDKITYDFGGFKIETALSNYILGQSGDQCMLAVLPSSEPAILGDFFLRDAYVVYDLENKEISLAQAAFDSSKEQIEPITSSGVPGAKKAPGYSDIWQDNDGSDFGF